MRKEQEKAKKAEICRRKRRKRLGDEGRQEKGQARLSNTANQGISS